MPTPNTQSLLRHTTMTAVVREYKNPNVFLKRFLWAREQELATEVIELGVIDNENREIAPLVRRGGEAVLVGGHKRVIQNLEAPNIRLKRAFETSEVLFGRQPGNVIFADQRTIVQAARQYMVDELMLVSDMIANAEEYMCSQILQGGISYAIEGQDAFTATVPRSASRNIVLSTFWDQASPTPLLDLHSVKELQSIDAQPGITDAICGTEAAQTILSLVADKTLTMTNTADNVQRVGVVTFESQFNEMGVIYLGRISGIDFWEYNRSALLNGSAVDMIRPKYIELVNRNSSASVSDRVMYYGAIDDMATLRGAKLATRRFAKSWEQQDPSALYHLVASRPLPWARRPNAHVSMKVVSG